MTMSPPANPSSPRRSLRTRPSAVASTSTGTIVVNNKVERDGAASVNCQVVVDTNTTSSSSRSRPSISSASASIDTFARRLSKRPSNEVKEQEGEEELGTSGTEEDEADEDRLSGEEDEDRKQEEEEQLPSGLGQSHGLSRSMTKPLTKYEEEGDSSVLNGRLKKKRRVTERRTLQNKTAQKKYRDKKKFLALRTLDFAVSMTRVCSRGLEGKERKAFKQILKDYLADVSELDQSYLADFLTKTGLHSKLLAE
ncbi:hypothetical protein CNL05540 [Cryptococcus deneoformans JEC21]|uniref:BZIP domain-containing protein n=1 Tax=Cryptococcus deneoformans (strain JEC21 / ATCC MYA-565) TaxID=214684 RepID=Q5K8I7_CRYD1|nr:hypothetical protein CNL05540 [Cryptococcus neoformans var. neoformans JEC21]AAW46573.1 hypothetical protein CNL05540 [Cryptococcus neoformans var. neoformans JEC21]